jgi:hypothetical protein
VTHCLGFPVDCAYDRSSFRQQKIIHRIAKNDGGRG